MNPPLGAYRLVGKTDVTPAIVNCEVNQCPCPPGSKGEAVVGRGPCGVPVRSL